jgi:hypothetical protein
MSYITHNSVTWNYGKYKLDVFNSCYLSGLWANNGHKVQPLVQSNDVAGLTEEACMYSHMPPKLAHLAIHVGLSFSRLPTAPHQVHASCLYSLSGEMRLLVLALLIGIPLSFHGREHAELLCRLLTTLS